MNRQILKLAIPNVISNITVPLVGIVDIALVGRLGSSSFIGGVGFGTMVFTLVYTGLAFLRMGTSGLTAQAYGASDFRQAATVLLRALCFSAIAGLILIALQKPLENLLILKLNGSKEALGIAGEYFRTRIYAAPATLSVFVFMGWFIGMQNSKIPMIITIVISLTNVVFSSFFVVYLDLGIKGVALGTVISQYVGLTFSLFYFIKYFKRISIFFTLKSIVKIDGLKRFFEVSRDIFIRSVLLTGSFFLFNAVSASMGDDILAMNSVMLQFLWFFAYVVDGFAYAGGTLVGRYKGAKNLVLLETAVRKSLLFAFYIAVIFTIFFILAAKPIFFALTDNVDVRILADEFIFWIWIMPLASFMAFQYDAIYVGLTATKTMRNIMIVIVLLIFIPGIFVLKSYFGNHGMWTAIILLMFFRGVGLRLFLKKSIALW